MTELCISYSLHVVCLCMFSLFVIASVLFDSEEKSDEIMNLLGEVR